MRTKEQINEAYSTACARLGELHVKKNDFTRLEAALFEIIRACENEMSILQEAETVSKEQENVNKEA